jgi:hypothetical protein
MKFHHYLFLVGSCIILLAVVKLNKFIREVDQVQQEQSTQQHIGLYRLDFVGQYCAETTMKVHVPRTFKYGNDFLATKEAHLVLRFVARYTSFWVVYVRPKGFFRNEYKLAHPESFVETVTMEKGDCIKGPGNKPITMFAEKEV